MASRKLLTLLAGLALVLAGCGSAAADPPPPGGELRIAMSAGNIPFPSTPPNEGYEGYRFVGNNIYDGLTRLNLDQNATLPTPQPALAESWTTSADLQTWTFHLRNGVRFHDGTPFDADAVIFQFDRLRTKDSEFYDATSAATAAAVFRYFDTWRKVDDATVEIHTTQPYAWLLWDLAAILFPSPTAVRTYGNAAYNQHATGTGAFRMTRYVDGEIMELTRNDDYWRGAAKLGRIVLYPQPEPASRLSMLQSNEVDWAEVPTPDSVQQLASEGYQISMGRYPHGIMPRFNMFRAPFAGNLALRQALNYALDREGTAALLNNVGYPASEYVYDGNPSFVAGNPGYHYDPERARQLLAEAGYAPGQLTITMAYPTGGSGNMYPDVMMQKLQADFAAIGVTDEPAAARVEHHHLHRPRRARRAAVERHRHPLGLAVRGDDADRVQHHVLLQPPRWAPQRRGPVRPAHGRRAEQRRPPARRGRPVRVPAADDDRRPRRRVLPVLDARPQPPRALTPRARVRPGAVVVGRLHDRSPLTRGGPEPWCVWQSPGPSWRCRSSSVSRSSSSC